MRTFNTKIAARTFCALLSLEAVLFTSLYLAPGSWSRSCWWAVNFPGYNLGDIIGRYLVHHGAVFMESSLLIGIGLFCTLIWSAFFGVIIREKSLV